MPQDTVVIWHVGIAPTAEHVSGRQTGKQEAGLLGKPQTYANNQALYSSLKDRLY